MFFSAKLSISYAITLLAFAPNRLTVFAAFSEQCADEMVSFDEDTTLQAIIDKSSPVDSNETAYFDDFSMVADEYATACLDLGGQAFFVDAMLDCDGDPTLTSISETYVSAPFCFGPSCSQAEVDEFLSIYFPTEPQEGDECIAIDGTVVISAGTTTGSDPAPSPVAGPPQSRLQLHPQLLEPPPRVV